MAPDLRGYGGSERPKEVENYTILDDIGDVVGLVDALGAEQAVIAGHDIGAPIAWQAALMRPDRFRAAGVWRLGAADDADAAEREGGVLPTLPSDSRG